MNKVIEVKNLSKKNNNFELKNVSFSIPEGCVAGFIGLNGQGKTTTIKTLLGLTKKDGGSVEIFGKNFERHEKEIKDDLAIVFDEGYLYDSLTMKEMKTIISRAYSNWDEKEYKKLMNKFLLNEKQKISTLSKGMKMKFALALALAHKAKFLIMDEPTSGLDPLVRRELSEILNDYMDRDGLGVFYSTHITSDLEKFADLIILINKGEIVFSENKDMLLDTHRLVKGEKKAFNDQLKDLFLKVDLTEYGFTGLSKEVDFLKKNYPEFIYEKPSIEDIMLAYV